MLGVKVENFVWLLIWSEIVLTFLTNENPDNDIQQITEEQ